MSQKLYRLLALVLPLFSASARGALKLRTMNHAAAILSFLMQDMEEITRKKVHLDSFKSVLEIGAGKIPLMPFLFYAAGSEKVVTVDIERQLRTLEWKMAFEINDLVHRILAPHIEPEKYERFILKLKQVISETPKFSNNIVYLAPIPATRYKTLGTFDFQFSYTVLEHVPEEDLHDLFQGIAQTLAVGGLSAHYVDHYNHAGGIFSPFNNIVIGPRSNQNSLGLPLDALEDAARGAGLEVVGRKDYKLANTWEAYLEEHKELTTARSPGGIVASLIVFERAV